MRADLPFDRMIDWLLEQIFGEGPARGRAGPASLRR